MSPSPGSSAPSATWTNGSVVILAFLTSGIDPLLEWLDAQTLHRVDEQFFGTVAQGEIGFDNVFDHVGNFGIANGRADQHAHLRVLVGTATNRDLVKFLAVLLDAENADMADMVMAAGIDAA